MTTRKKRILIVAFALIFIGCSIVGWTAIKIVAWANELPNRIVVEIDGDGFANAFGSAVTESYHQALRDGDSALQLQIITDQFIPAIAENHDHATWIRDEYQNDIRLLVDSNDPAVSSAASDLLSLLESDSDSPLP
jgi:hypothetical protein